MSSAAFAEGPSGVYAAWENDGQVFFARVGPDKVTKITPIAPFGTGRERKHPAVAIGKNGDVILVWTEGTGWERGGLPAWQVFDKASAETSDFGVQRRGIPVWGLPAVVAEPDGRFSIIH
jgi:hypothetical protein